MRPHHHGVENVVWLFKFDFFQQKPHWGIHNLIFSGESKDSLPNNNRIFYLSVRNSTNLYLWSFYW